MSTTHIIAINGDFIKTIEEHPAYFAAALRHACSTCQPDAELEGVFRATYLGHSMHGVNQALANSSQSKPGFIERR